MASDFEKRRPDEKTYNTAISGEDEIIHRLGRVYRKQVRNAESLITRRFNMRMTEFIILQMLGSIGPMRLRLIATERFLLSEEVFVAAGTLLERGFIRFTKNGGHFGPAEITTLGRRISDRLYPHMLERQKKLTAHLAKQNRTRLLNILTGIEALLDEEAVTQQATALELDQLADLMDGNDIAA